MGSSYGANVHPGFNTLVRKDNATGIKASEMRHPSRMVAFTGWGAYRAGWLGEGLEDLKGGKVPAGYLNMRWHGLDKPRWSTRSWSGRITRSTATNSRPLGQAPGAVSSCFGLRTIARKLARSLGQEHQQYEHFMQNVALCDDRLVCCDGVAARRGCDTGTNRFRAGESRNDS